MRRLELRAVQVVAVAACLMVGALLIDRRTPSTAVSSDSRAGLLEQGTTAHVNEQGQRERAEPAGTQPHHTTIEDVGGDIRAIRECLSVASSTASKVECVRRALNANGVPSPQELADVMCSGPDSPGDYSMCIGEAMLHLSGSDAWLYIGRLQNACSRYRETNLLIDAVRYARLVNPAWGTQLWQSIAAESIFDPAVGEAPIQLLELFVQEGDATAKTIVEFGGRGAFGGDPRQCLRSAVICVVNEPDPNKKLAYLDSVLVADTRPADPRIGSMFVEMLIADHATWPSGKSTPALELLARVLEVHACRKSAAGAVLQHQDLQVAKGDEELWAFLLAESERALREP